MNAPHVGWLCEDCNHVVLEADAKWRVRLLVTVKKYVTAICQACIAKGSKT